MMQTPFFLRRKRHWECIFSELGLFWPFFVDKSILRWKVAFPVENLIIFGQNAVEDYSEFVARNIRICRPDLALIKI